MGLAHRSLFSPCRSFFSFSLLFSLCSSFRMTPWGTGALWVHFFAWASKTQSGRRPASLPGRGRPASSTPPRGRLWPPWTEQVPCQELYWLSVLIKEDQALLSALLSFHLGCHPEGTPGSCWGWTPAEREVIQSCPTLCNPMACSLPGSSIHGIFQARVLEWGAITFSGYSLWGRKELDMTERLHFLSFNAWYSLFNLAIQVDL